VSLSFSIVMPTFNGEKFVGAALESVRQQNDRELEVIVVDDGSFDRTLDIVREFMTTLPIRLIEHKRIGNWVAMTNIGLREARGDWVSFLHQDDLWLSGRLAKVRSEIAQGEGAMVLHNSVLIGPNGQRLGLSTCPLARGNVSPSGFIEHLLIQNFIALPAPAFRRKAVLDSGGLDEALWFTADWDLWLRLGAMGRVRFLPDRLTGFRIHPESQTAARPLASGEWKRQLETVFNRHLERWNGTGSRRRAVTRAGQASMAVSTALAGLSRGQRASLREPLQKLVTLSPSAWSRFLRDSRIVQRVWPRLKLWLLPESQCVKVRSSAELKCSEKGKQEDLCSAPK
jgi:GT2 family glycosyltransferase